MSLRVKKVGSKDVGERCLEGRAPECQEKGNEAWLKLSKKAQLRNR